MLMLYDGWDRVIQDSRLVRLAVLDAGILRDSYKAY